MWKSIFFSKVFILIEIIFLILASVSLIKILDKKTQREQEIDKLKQHFLTLKNQNFDLLEKLKEINTNSYVEIEAKKRLNLKRQGEKVVVFVKEPSSNLEINIESKNKANIASLSNLVLWWRYFVGD